MSHFHRSRIRARAFAGAALLCLALALAACRHEPARWTGTWATSPMKAQASDAPRDLSDATLRQVVRVSIGGPTLRLRFSNAFGAAPLSFHSVHVAASAGPEPDGAIQTESTRAVTFHGQSGIVIPQGAVMLSDPIEYTLAPLSDLVVSIHIDKAPETLTVHPGSRTTSYLKSGDATAMPDAEGFESVVSWYFLTGVDVLATPPSNAIAILGDSITDGYGTTTNKNNRWTDHFARRLHENAATARVAVLNHGIGGNRLLRDGLGPNALARFERDVLAQTGVRWLIVFMGINDIGTRKAARERGEAFATAGEIIGAYEQIIARARAHGIQIIGATITPYEGSENYWTEDGERDRQQINQWIRTDGVFDALIDFDAALRDPRNPARLAAAFDSGDHLHPSLAGYEHMAAVVDLELFAR